MCTDLCRTHREKKHLDLSHLWLTPRLQLVPLSLTIIITDQEQTKKLFSNSRLKETDPDSDLDSVELVDLAEDLSSPVSYAQRGPHDYRKLHALHTSIHGDKSVRLPKRNPQPSNPNVDISHSQENLPMGNPFDDGSIDDDELPSPSQLFAGFELVEEVDTTTTPESAKPVNQFEDAFEPLAALYLQEASLSPSYGDDSLELFEGNLVRLGFTDMLTQATPKGTSSFDCSKAGDLFNVDAFEFRDDSPIKAMVSSYREKVASGGTSSQINRKRDRSPCLDTKPSKRHQSYTEGEEAKDDNEKKAASMLTTPLWVSDFDSDLFDGLKDYVEFVD